MFSDNVALPVSGLALLVIACSTSSEYTNSCSYGHRQGGVEIFNSPSFRICNLFPDLYIHWDEFECIVSHVHEMFRI